MNTNDVYISKTLSWLLRHAATKEGLEISSDGFVNVEDILQHPKLKQSSVLDILKIVEVNDKQRFTLKHEGSAIFIKANQGHSLQVNDLDLLPILSHEQEPTVFHGTYFDKWKLIKTQGLKRMQRLHIHFATDVKAISGVRRNCQVFIYINLKEALKAGLQFFKSPNGVVLSPGNSQGVIETKYFLNVIDVQTGAQLSF